jgi:hypothetical protein
MRELRSLQDAISLIVGSESEFGKMVAKSSLFPYWFRGQSNAEWELTPGVFRKNSSGDYLYDEYNMMGDMRLSNPEEAQRCSTTVEWLVLTQHYGLPTRLLDWSESILVALYFAVQNDQVDGRLIILLPFRLNSQTSLRKTKNICMAGFPDAILRADQSICSCYEELRDRLKYAFAKGEYYTKYLDSFGEERIREILNLPVAVYPARNNPRITSQSGMFTLHGGTVPSHSHDSDFGEPVSLEDLDKGGRKIMINFRIPAEAKEQIRTDLQRLGIHQASLFPEFEYQAQHIRQKWTWEL